MNKYTSNSLKGFVLKADLEYLKELRELHNDYDLVPDKIESKRGMLSEYQLNTTDLYNIPIGYVKILVPNFSDNEKYVPRYLNLQLYLRLGLKLIYKICQSIKIWWCFWLGILNLKNAKHLEISK